MFDAGTDLEETNMEVYDGLVKEIARGGKTFGYVASEYGETEAALLIDDGCVCDYGSQEIIFREDRFPEAEEEFRTFMDYSPGEAAKSSGKGLSSLVLPVVSGAMAVNTGGEPFWVGMTGFSSYLGRDILKQSIAEVQMEYEKWKNFREAAKQYRLGDFDKEDFELQVKGVKEYWEWINGLDPENQDLRVKERVPEVNIMAAFGISEEGELLE